MIWKHLLKALEKLQHLERAANTINHFKEKLVNSYCSLLAHIEAKAIIHEVEVKPHGNLQLKYTTAEELLHHLKRRKAILLMEIHEVNETYPYTYSLLAYRGKAVKLTSRFKVVRDEYVQWQQLQPA